MNCLKHTLIFRNLYYLAKFKVSFRLVQQVETMYKNPEDRISPLILTFI